eukprot:4467319-Prymnesium_polylepis.1
MRPSSTPPHLSSTHATLLRPHVTCAPCPHPQLLHPLIPCAPPLLAHPRREGQARTRRARFCPCPCGSPRHTCETPRLSWR